MKKMIFSFTFWFIIVGIIGITLNLTEADDIGLFIGLNPVLNILSSANKCCDYINAVPYLWHILSIVTMTGYGLILDGIKVIIKKKKS